MYRVYRNEPRLLEATLTFSSAATRSSKKNVVGDREKSLSLCHARAVILWGGFSVEVDGGSNRGAREASLASRTETPRGRSKARRSARRLTVRKNPAEIGRSKCRTYLLRRPIVVTTAASAMPSVGKCARIVSAT